MPDASASAFEQIKHTDEQGEYWSARELSKLLGYTSWQNFETVIDEARAVCQASGGVVERLFTAVIRKSRGRNARDYRLTRHACYLVAESADGRKAEVALAKIYFALTTERYELLAQIRERKGLKRGQDISDYMGSLETASNLFRAALAKQLMDDRGVQDLPTANSTHHEAGDSVRTLLLSKGIVPEALPTPRKSFQQLLREEEARQQIIAEDRLGLWGRLEVPPDDASDVDSDGGDGEP